VSSFVPLVYLTMQLDYSPTPIISGYKLLVCNRWQTTWD